tara:strand:+ start:1315 stop:2700 length:1386 start_codon:yes stop_codon:yes gene_type:complete
MGLTKISTDGVKDDAITKAKIPADQIEASELANNAVDTNAIQDDAVTGPKIAQEIDNSHITNAANIAGSKLADNSISLAKLEHGDSNNDGKFLRANNGADPTFETITTTPADGSITRAKLSDNVKTSVAGRNMIINGACRISQRLETGGNNTAIINDSNANSGSEWIAFPVDRFVCWSVGGGALTIQRSDDVPAGKGFSNSLMMTCSTTDTDALSQSNTYYILQHRIEAHNTNRLSMGGTGAKSSTLSFWVKAPAGTYGVHISNHLQNRVYLKEFTVSANQTWEYITLTFPGDTTGTWEKYTNSGVQINWTLAAGTNYQSTADQWNTAWKSHTSNQFNFMGTVNNIFRMTGIQYEVGTEATEFEHKQINQDNADCLRYFYKHKIVDSVGPYFLQYHATHKFLHDWFPQEMRVAPSASVSFNGGSGHTAYKISTTHYKAYMGSSYTDTSSYHLQSASYSAEL